MKKRIFSVALAICLVLSLMPMSVFADSAEVIRIDVGGANVDNENYQIDDNQIILRKRDVTYELTGTTDKNISLWGSNDAADINQAFYIRANGVAVNGGIIVQNSPVKMVLELAGENTISKLSANDLTIKGAGTLYATSLSVTQATSYMPSALHITDATVVVNTSTSAGDSCEWNGPCVLDGSASVKFISNNDYAALKVGVKSGDDTHSLTLKDNAKLYCLQADASNPAAYSVSGLELHSSAVLHLQDSSYLEAEGRDATGSYQGCGIISQKDIIVEDSAMIKATGYDAAISTGGSVKVSGGTLEVRSEHSNGIYADVGIEITDGANVTAAGYFPAIFGNDSVLVSNSTVDATSTNDIAIFSPGNVTIENSRAKANAADGDNGISARNNYTVSGSWVESTGGETPNTITNSAYLNGNSGKVTGDLTLPGSVTLPEGKTLDIPEGASLTVGGGNTFTNNGAVSVNGTITNNGTVVCNSHSGGKATCKDQAICDLCKEPYGDLDTKNHIDLVKTNAVDATVEHTGNTEYWYCSGCEKYFADEQGENEITKEDTVLPQLAPEIIEGTNGKWTLGGKDTLRFVSNAPYADFRSVSVDGTVIGAENYTVSEGSTVVELKPEILNTLVTGEHALVISSTAGDAKTQFTVLAVPTATPTATPTAVPSASPTEAPTATPTATPTAAPSASPTAVPTATPTATPTTAPSASPTAASTATPTVKPTATPTPVPKADPNNPKTGSSNLPVVFGSAALVLSGGALAAVLIYKKKRHEK